MTATATPAIAAAILRARRSVVDHLTAAGATNANSSVSYIPDRRLKRKALAYLERHGAVTAVSGGTYWVDVEKAAALRRRTRTRAAVLIGGALAAAATIFAMTR